MPKLCLLLLMTVLPSFTLAADMNATKVPGYQFSLIDVEKSCIAVRNGMSDSLSIECKGQHLNPVRRSCEGFINGGLENVKLNCGGGLWILNTKCKVEMRGARKGEFNCKI